MIDQILLPALDEDREAHLTSKSVNELQSMLRALNEGCVTHEQRTAAVEEHLVGRLPWHGEKRVVVSLYLTKETKCLRERAERPDLVKPCSIKFPEPGPVCAGRIAQPALRLGLLLRGC
jgi:hypothetical protein